MTVRHGKSPPILKFGKLVNLYFDYGHCLTIANNVTVITRPGNALVLDQTSTLDLKTTRSRLPGKTHLVLHILLFVDLRVFNEIILNPLNNPYYEYRFARSHHQIPIKKHPSIPFSHRTLGPHLKKTPWGCDPSTWNFTPFFCH